MERAGWRAGCLDGSLVPELFALPVKPVTSRRLVSDAAERRAALEAAVASSGLRSLADGSFRPPVPRRAVACAADAAWVAAPGRYRVSRKADGTRHLLIAAEGGEAYLLNRAGMLYRYPLELSRSGCATASQGGDGGGSGGVSGDESRVAGDGSSWGGGDTGSGGGGIGDGGGGGSGSGNSGGGCTRLELPPGTILDGELLWCGPPSDRRGFFLACDALSIGGGAPAPRLWAQPLADRLAAPSETCGRAVVVVAPGCSWSSQPATTALVVGTQRLTSGRHNQPPVCGDPGSPQPCGGSWRPRTLRRICCGLCS
jgi:hypothetical protein